MCYAVLDYIYRQKKPSEKFNCEELSKLVLIADQYLLPNLTRQCELLLLRRLSIDNIGEVLMLAWTISKTHDTVKNLARNI